MPEHTTAPCTSFNLRKATRLVSQLYDNALRPAGLRNTQFTLLRVLEARGPLSIHELAEALVTDRTTLTRNLKPLERDGLVRSGSGEDLRVRQISMTPKGKRVLGRAYPLWEEVQSTLNRRLGTGEVQRLVRGLQAAVEELRGS